MDADGALRGGIPRPGLREYAALFVLTLSVGLSAVDRNMLGLLLPLIRQDIVISDTELGLLMGPAFMIVYSLSGLPIAWIADRTGRRNIIAVGLVVWSAILVLTGFAATLMQLLILRMLLAVGEATNMAPSSALIGDMFRDRYRLMAMAVLSAGGALAIMAFYPFIGWLAQHRGWQIVYPVMGGIGLLTALLVMGIVRDHEKEVDETPVADGELGFKSAVGTLLRTRSYVFLCLAGAAVSVNYSVLLLWLPTFFERIHGLSTEQVGGLIGTYKGLIGACSTFAAGLLITWLMRYDRRWLTRAPVLFCLGMVPAQILLLMARDPFWYEFGLAVETILMSGITPSLFGLLMMLVAPRMRATGTALYLIMFNLVGQSFGPPLVGWVNDHVLSGMGTEAIRYSMLIAPGAIFVAALLLMRLAYAVHGDRPAQSPVPEAA